MKIEPPYLRSAEYIFWETDLLAALGVLETNLNALLEEVMLFTIPHTLAILENKLQSGDSFSFHCLAGFRCSVCFRQKSLFTFPDLIPGAKADQACCAAVYTVFNTLGHIDQRQNQKILSRLTLYRLSVHNAILLVPEKIGPIRLGGFTWCPHDLTEYNAMGKCAFTFYEIEDILKQDLCFEDFLSLTCDCTRKYRQTLESDVDAEHTGQHITGLF